MKFADVNGQRQEAQHGLLGSCSGCLQPMVAKCGQVRIWHWAHLGRRDCDRWWESETKWHRDWKDQFPADWQEIAHPAGDGERHIADVKTHDGWVLEFQHSHLRSEERRAREAFYQSLIWVVDGLRRGRDLAQFSRAWTRGESRHPLSSKRRISAPDSALFRDWAGSPAHVFFDFGDGQALWWLFPESDDKRAYVQLISRAQFVRIHRERHTHAPSEFDSLVQNFSAFIACYESPPPTRRPLRLTEMLPHPNRRPMIQRGFRL
jgi:hypothetical protein